jgi:rfaE bifunctional protein kinase chain/domain
MITEQRARNILTGFKDKNILVIGDVILDRYLHGDVKRISPEAPVPVLNIHSEEYKAGGAANVSNNIQSLNAGSVLIGIAGKDAYGEQLSSVMQDASNILFRDYAVTIVKSRIVARTQQILRIDRERKNLPHKSDEELIIKKIKQSKVDGIILSDYAKGFLTEEISRALLQKSRMDGIPYLIDPKPLNHDLYNECSYICPNTLEAEQLSGLLISNDDFAEKAARIIKHKYNCDSTLITRGERGITGLGKDDKVFHIPSISHGVYDVTGAGDSVAAILILSITSSASFQEAAELANIGASLTIERLGTATVSVEGILKRLKLLTESINMN